MILSSICDCQNLAAMMDANPKLPAKRDFATVSHALFLCLCILDFKSFLVSLYVCTVCMAVYLCILCMDMYGYVCVYGYVYIYGYVCMYVWLCMYVFYVWICMAMYVCMAMYIYMAMYVCMAMYVSSTVQKRFNIHQIVDTCAAIKTTPNR